MLVKLDILPNITTCYPSLQPQGLDIYHCGLGFTVDDNLRYWIDFNTRGVTKTQEVEFYIGDRKRRELIREPVLPEEADILRERVLRLPELCHARKKALDILSTLCTSSESGVTEASLCA